MGSVPVGGAAVWQPRHWWMVGLATAPLWIAAILAILLRSWRIVLIQIALNVCWSLASYLLEADRGHVQISRSLLVRAAVRLSRLWWLAVVISAATAAAGLWSCVADRSLLAGAMFAVSVLLACAAGSEFRIRVESLGVTPVLRVLRV